MVACGIFSCGMQSPVPWLGIEPGPWLTGKDPDAWKDWGQEEKGTTEDEMVRWHHWLNGHGFGWTPVVGNRQGGLGCCGSLGCKESDTTEWLNWRHGSNVDVLNRWMDKAMVHRCNGILLSHKKECIWVSSNEVGEPAAYYRVNVNVKSLSRVQLFATPWTIAYQAPLSMGFSRQ